MALVGFYSWSTAHEPCKAWRSWGRGRYSHSLISCLMCAADTLFSLTLAIPLCKHSLNGMPVMI